jgi:hypothetical protein
MPFQALPKLSVQKLFAVALILKIILSGLGLLLNEPWILGMALPITVMILYMVVGHRAAEDDVSPEKFADSCYYIGFIFTMSSIIFSLFDLPNLGAADGMRNIALRFGAAMVSTVLGMGVRVYLVSFRKDASDAIKDAEEAVLDATRMLASQLGAIVDELKQFEIQVIDASKVTVENVNRQISDLGQSYAKSLNGFYVQVTEENKAAFKVLVEEVHQATVRLAASVDTYSHGMNVNIESIKSKVTEFAEAVSFRLANTTFPDDFFARELKAPLDQLRSEALNLGGSVRNVSSLVQESSVTLAAVLKHITSKTKKTQDAMDAVVQLSEQHRTLVDNTDMQLTSLVKVAERLEQVDAALKGALEVIGANSSASAELLTNITRLSVESADLRVEIKDSILSLTGKLDANAVLASSVIQTLESQAGGLRTSASGVIASLEHHADSTQKLSNQLGSVETVFQGAVEQLKVIAGGSVELVDNARQVMEHALPADQSASRASESVNTLIAPVSNDAGQVKDLDIPARIHTGNVMEFTQGRQHQHERAYPMRNAEATAPADAFRVTPATAVSASNGVNGDDDHLDANVISNLLSEEPIAINSNGANGSPVLSPTSSNA